jgi:DNA mismatch repair protein MutL
MPIEVLAPEVVSKIAAGEVVERPSSVVKELIENSLDAGATQVSVEARGGGVRLVRVTDNGSGMPAVEVGVAFQRHATSKISGLSDLDAISSLGFRGEALPSIAAVARVEVLARTSDELSGTFLRLENGSPVESGERAGPRGTSITVRDLFQNVPARLKFLKSPSTESGHISNLVAQYSMAYPEVRFSLNLDGRAVLQTPGSGELHDVLVEVYGLKTSEAMIAVGESGSPVSGYVSPPSVSRSSRAYLSFFVNRRWVNSRLLARATLDAYKGLLMTGKHPIVVLNIAVPNQDTDVNVHPSKTEIKFRDEQGIFTVVQRAVRAALVEETAVPQMSRHPQAVGGAGTAGAHTAIPNMGPSSMKAGQAELFEGTAAAGPLDSDSAAVELRPTSRLPILRVLGQMAATYIIAEGPDGLYLIDQHAAHERVLFDQVRRQHAGMEVEVQGMLDPLTLEVTPRQEGIVEANSDILSSYGFDFEPFGQRTYLLRAVPSVLAEGDIPQAVGEILDCIGEGRGTGEGEDRIAASIACHSAVRAGQVLSAEEISKLVSDMEQSATPQTCPHGRPTMIHFTSSQLEREFGRSL